MDINTMTQTQTQTQTHTPLYMYAGRVKRDWKDMPTEVKPHVSAMYDLDQITDGLARAVVVKFLHTSTKWKGDMAREVKRELKKLTNCKVD